MKRKQIFNLAFLLLVFGCSKDRSNFANAPIYPSPPSGAYKLSWYEDFSGAVLDTSKWSYRANGLRRQGFNSPEAIAMDTLNHNLHIKNFLRNDTVFTGMIGTIGKFEQLYGFFECRAKLPLITKGYWPAFWIHSSLFGKTNNPEESGIEVDIMEYVNGNPYAVNHAMHWNGYGVDLQSMSWETQSTTLADGNFHTYGLEWTPAGYKFYTDQRLVWEVNSPVSKVKQYIILSCEIGDKKLFIDKFGNESEDFIVDYIKVYEWKP